MERGERVEGGVKATCGISLLQLGNPEYIGGSTHPAKDHICLTAVVAVSIW